MKNILISALMLLSGAFAQSTFTVTSPVLTDGGTLPLDQVFNTWGCEGQNISPELRWSGAPEGTKSFAVTAYDPDAPTGSGWWHWLVFNIPAEVNTLPAGAGSTHKDLLPKGAVQSLTDFGQSGYGGACPPAGAPHHYVFTVFALKTSDLGLSENTMPATVGFNLNSNALAKASITVTYGR